MSRDADNALSRDDAQNLANQVGQWAVNHLAANARVNVVQGAPQVSVTQGPAQVQVHQKPPTALANTQVDLQPEWGSVPVKIDGVVNDYAFEAEQYIASYIPVTRFREVSGPEYPDPLGNAIAFSDEVFVFDFSGETMLLHSATLRAGTVAPGTTSGA